MSRLSLITCATEKMLYVVTIDMVRNMLRSYSVVSFVASIFAVGAIAWADSSGSTISVHPRKVQASRSGRVLVQGFVLATDSCQLAPADWAGACTSLVIPIEGHLALLKRATNRRLIVKLDSSGVFSRKLAPGAYRVRLVRPHIQGRFLKRAEYRIYPPRVRIEPQSARNSQGAGQANVFLVAHRSRAVPPRIGISD